MSMERFTVTMSSEDIDVFERGRSNVGMSKSAFIRLLVAEHTNSVPSFIKYKEIIQEISALNTYIKEIVLSNISDESYKVLLIEKLNELKELYKKLL